MKNSRRLKIVNMALLQLGETPIDNLKDGRVGELVKILFDVIMETLDNNIPDEIIARRVAVDFCIPLTGDLELCNYLSQAYKFEIEQYRTHNKTHNPPLELL